LQFDIVIIVLTLVFVGVGFRNGAVYTLFHTFGWIGALLIAFFLRSPLTTFLKDQTSIYDLHYGNVEAVCRGFFDKYASGVAENVPESISDEVTEVGSKAVYEVTDKIASATFTVLVFLLIFVAVKFVSFVLIRVFSKRNRDGFTSAMDGALGALLGLVQAACLIFVLLALLGPVSLVVSAEAFDQACEVMDKSIFAQYLYEKNPLTLLISEAGANSYLLSEWIDPDDFAFPKVSADEMV
jgi:uncharacterized membrane protein required for colicin V production